MISPLRLVVPLAFLAAASCSSAATPGAPVKYFALNSIDGRPLPTSSTSLPNSSAVTIQSEDLALGSEGIATRRTVVSGPSTAVARLQITQYAYTLSDGVVILGNQICPPGYVCIEHLPEQGRIDQITGSLTIGPASGPVFVYRSPFLGD